MSEPAAAPAPPAGTPPAAAPPVRIGLVGAGFIARWMMEAVAVVPGAQAVAVASAHPERAEAFAAAHSIARSYAGLPRMLEGGRRAGAGPRSRLPVRGRRGLHDRGGQKHPLKGPNKRGLHDRGGHGRERRGPAPRPSAAAPGPSRHGGSAGIRTQGGYEPHRLSRSAPSAARTRYLRR